MRWPRPGSASCWSKRPTDSAARRSCRATPNWCRPASGPRTPSAAWSSAIESNKLVEVSKNATVKTFVGGPGDFHAHAVRRHAGRGGRRHPVHRLHAFRLDQQAGMGLRHLSRRGHHHAGRADVLVRQGRALSVRRARAASGSRFCSASARATARSAANGARKSAARSRRTWRWRSARRCRIAASTSTTWISAPSASTRATTTGRARRSTRSSTSRRASPR